MASHFKSGGQSFKLNEYFKSGGSLTHEEATEMGVGRLAQRVQDLKKKYIEIAGWSPLMVISEQNKRGGKRARYFYRGAGCHLENNINAKAY